MCSAGKEPQAGQERPLYLSSNDKKEWPPRRSLRVYLKGSGSLLIYFLLREIAPEKATSSLRIGGAFLPRDITTKTHTFIL
jgi:hypothetical protein